MHAVTCVVIERNTQACRLLRSVYPLMLYSGSKQDGDTYINAESNGDSYMNEGSCNQRTAVPLATVLQRPRAYYKR